MSRGLDFEGGIKEKVLKLRSIILPVFFLSLKRADDIADILDIRFYDSSKEVTKNKRCKNSSKDDVIILLNIILLIIYIFIGVVL